MAHCSQDPIRTIFDYNFFMNLLFVLGMALCAQAADFVWQTAPRELVVRKEPREGARVLFYIPPGDRLMVGPETSGFRKIRTRGPRGIKSGFVSIHEFTPPDWREEALAASAWGVGPAFMSSRLVQANKAFATSDQVQYTTTDYVSSTVFPLITAQRGREDFWRVQALWRQTRFKFTARSDVDSLPRDVELAHKMLGLALQKGWTAGFFRPLYGGLGVEGARAFTTELKMNGNELDTDEASRPLYLAAHAFGGFHFLLARQWSFYFEGRYNWIPNQTPVLTGTDFSLALMYWP
jgi:hypothetical protein